ncbi:hypothetical protein GWK41_05050 [Persephonella atlantica]|uniref:Uncharacterized protein n=1 Tax=Persephonella atlantica TaxID=2699429 RepID=A0ABS1GI52_9AQUI|nr:hypothetical protein [Persephonella atlantica]MBK3332427.1 hypothetical protein [Persephonella atlantica]
MKIMSVFFLILFFLLYHISSAITLKNAKITEKLSKDKENTKVYNVLVKEIKKDRIVSINGKIYKLQNSTKIIKNYKKKPIIAEFHLRGDKIILVILK